MFLVRENVHLLALPHGFPTLDGVQRGIAAVARVPQDAAQHARVRGGNAVVPVQVQLGQAGDIHPESILAFEVRHQPGVQPMDAFQDDNIAFVQFGAFTFQAAPGLEVKTRQLHFLAIHQAAHVCV